MVPIVLDLWGSGAKNKLMVEDEDEELWGMFERIGGDSCGLEDACHGGQARGIRTVHDGMFPSSIRVWDSSTVNPHRPNPTLASITPTPTPAKPLSS